MSHQTSATISVILVFSFVLRLFVEDGMFMHYLLCLYLYILMRALTLNES